MPVLGPSQVDTGRPFDLGPTVASRLASRDEALSSAGLMFESRRSLSPLWVRSAGFVRSSCGRQTRYLEALIRCTERLLPQSTALTRCSPRASRPTFSAIVCLRRLMVPSVQPDMCGVMVTLGRLSKGRLPGIGL